MTVQNVAPLAHEVATGVVSIAVMTRRVARVVCVAVGLVVVVAAGRTVSVCQQTRKATHRSR